MRYLPENVLHIDTDIQRLIDASLPDPSALLYLDEVYVAVMRQLYLLYTMQSFDQILDSFLEGWYINPYAEVSLDELARFAVNVRFFSELFYAHVDELYEEIEKVENEAVASGAALGENVKSARMLMEKVKVGISREANLSSIKDELIIYDTFDSSTYFTQGDAGIDTDNGFITLRQTNISRVGYTIKEVSTRGVPRGEILTPVFGKDTFNAIKNGYFHGRTFSASPRINDTSASAVEAIFDNNITTGYEVELNSTVILREGFGITLSIVPSSLCNVFSLSCISPTTESTIASPSYQLFLDLFRFGGRDYSLSLTDNRITAETMTCGDIEPVWSYGTVSSLTKNYPTLPTTDLIDVGLVSFTPQLASFPEIVFLNSENREVHRMNYFETLAVRKTEVPEGTLNPRSLFTEEQLAKLAANISLSKLTVHTELVSIYRYYVGIKELALSLASYTNASEAISRNLNAGGKRIAAVDIYTREDVPEKTSITYFVSVDKQSWIPIVPANSISSGPKRIVFSTSVDSRDSDYFVQGVQPRELYVKIVLTGGGYVTPKVRSFVARMKVEAD